ncbi:MAG: HD domain-containing protein [Chloroflexota bacterium]
MKLKEYLSGFPELGTLYAIVEEDFRTRGLLHHNWNHILRDLARGIIIGEAEKANMKVVLGSILLHDIGRLYPRSGQDHHSIGATIAPQYLTRAGFTEEEIEEVVHCVRCHGPRGLEEPSALEAKVTYDVDVLSCSVGYIGVARVFDYFMREEGMNVKQMVALPSGRKGPREDFYTETGRKFGEGGLKRARKFWEELDHEFAEERKVVTEIIPDYEGD